MGQDEVCIDHITGAGQSWGLDSGTAGGVAARGALPVAAALQPSCQGSLGGINFQRLVVSKCAQVPQLVIRSLCRSSG